LNILICFCFFFDSSIFQITLFLCVCLFVSCVKTDIIENLIVIVIVMSILFL
jgi:hypothetical protein